MLKIKATPHLRFLNNFKSPGVMVRSQIHPNQLPCPEIRQSRDTITLWSNCGLGLHLLIISSAFSIQILQQRINGAVFDRNSCHSISVDRRFS